MNLYIYYDQTGRITAESSTQMFGHESRASLMTDLPPPVLLSHYVQDGRLVPKPLQPTPHHTFNYTTKQWIDPRTLADLQAARRAYVNTARLTANQTYFTHEGKQIAADPLSRSDIDAINGEVNNTGGFPAGWPGAWKCLDNTWLPVTTIAQWKALYTSMVNQGTANFAHAQNLKARIDAATTPEQVAAVVW